MLERQWTGRNCRPTFTGSVDEYFANGENGLDSSVVRRLVGAAVNQLAVKTIIVPPGIIAINNQPFRIIAKSKIQL